MVGKVGLYSTAIRRTLRKTDFDQTKRRNLTCKVAHRVSFNGTIISIIIANNN